MKKPFRSWDGILKKLNLRWRTEPKPRRRKPRSSQIETLEPKQLLAADLIASQFGSDGSDLFVQYDVVGQAATPFDVNVYRSSDGVTPDALLTTQRISDSADQQTRIGHQENDLSACEKALHHARRRHGTPA